MPTPTFTLVDHASAGSVGFDGVMDAGQPTPTNWRWQSLDGNLQEWETTPATGATTSILTTVPGMYWAYPEAGGNGVPKRLQVTDQLSAVATRCRVSIAATIALLGLQDIGTNIYQQKQIDSTGLTYPCVAVDVLGLAEGQETGLDGLDYVVYPVRVMICDSNVSATDHSQLAKYELWRQKLLRAFRFPHLTDVPENAYIKVEPQLIVDPQSPEYQHFVSGIIIRSTCREARGIGA